MVTTEGFKQDCLSLLLSLPQVILSVARSPFPQASSPSFFFFFSLSILSFFLTHFYYRIPFNSTILLFYHIPSFLLIETLFTITSCIQTLFKTQYFLQINCAEHNSKLILWFWIDYRHQCADLWI